MVVNCSFVLFYTDHTQVTSPPLKKARHHCYGTKGSRPCKVFNDCTTTDDFVLHPSSYLHPFEPIGESPFTRVKRTTRWGSTTIHLFLSHLKFKVVIQKKEFSVFKCLLPNITEYSTNSIDKGLFLFLSLYDRTGLKVRERRETPIKVIKKIICPHRKP